MTEVIGYQKKRMIILEDCSLWIVGKNKNSFVLGLLAWTIKWQASYRLLLCVKLVETVKVPLVFKVLVLMESFLCSCGLSLTCLEELSNKYPLNKSSMRRKKGYDTENTFFLILWTEFRLKRRAFCFIRSAVSSGVTICCLLSKLSWLDYWEREKKIML